MLSAHQVAKILGCTQDYVGKLCREGKLVARRSENVWLISGNSIAVFIEQRDIAKKERSLELVRLRKEEKKAFNKLFFKRKRLPYFNFMLGGSILLSVIVFASTFATQTIYFSHISENGPISTFFSLPSVGFLPSQALVASVETPSILLEREGASALKQTQSNWTFSFSLSTTSHISSPQMYFVSTSTLASPTNI